MGWDPSGILLKGVLCNYAKAMYAVERHEQASSDCSLDVMFVSETHEHEIIGRKIRRVV